MAILEEFLDSPGVTTGQRWGHFITLAWGVIAVAIVLNIRAGIFNTVSVYTNNEAGLVATYPSGWLLDEDGDYIFRVRDMQQIGYKTTYEVNLRPIGPTTTTRTITDTLAMQRSQTLAAYRIFATDPFPLSQDPDARQITYTYVDTQTNPFLETIPDVVVGIDIVAISRGQAVIITLRSDPEILERNREQFFRFVDQMEF